MEKKRMNSQEAAKYLGISDSALRQSRTENAKHLGLIPPPYYKLGRRVMYDSSELDAWLSNYRVLSKKKIASAKLS